MSKLIKTPISIARQCYAMVSQNGSEAEITMYGEIVRRRPVNYWTDEPIEGSFIIEDEFLADLEKLSKCSKITVRINSLGGDTSVSNLIHNRLRELAANGCELVCIVDGVAMSAGTHIMCACDRVIVHPSSLIMIHKCIAQMWGWYNADELRSEAQTNDAWDKTQIAIYQRKTELSEAVISHMMSNTTYLSGKEAIEKGFADELSEDDGVKIAASANRRIIYAGERVIMLGSGMTAPEYIPIEAETKASETINNNAKEVKNMAKNLEELRKENPELASQVEADIRASLVSENDQTRENAVAAERQRLAEIDEIAALYDDETVRNAKYGDNACNASELALRAAKEAAKTGNAFMAGALRDAQASGANNVTSAPAPEDVPESTPKTGEEKMAKARADVNALLSKNN
ncbi:MAG: Clp protease ClpP [Clostridia bacterium]|nr:Clp protease ClpP [Clostridia bacterium]